MFSANDISMGWGEELTAADLANLLSRWITPDLAEQAGIRRVNSMIGSQMFSRNGGRDMSGIIIPNIFPGESNPREYRIRLDHPDYEVRADGTHREMGKYLGPPGRPILAYFPVGVEPKMLTDVTLPVLITEGELKDIALWRLAWFHAKQARFLPVGLQGVDCWRGTVGHTDNANGKRVAVKGMLPDLVSRMAWKNRPVIIAYDSDPEFNEHVLKARTRLMYALVELGALVGILEWPAPEGKGIDDRLANIGPERVLHDIEHVEFGGWQTRLLRTSTGKLTPSYENAALFLENAPEWVGVLGYNEFTGGHVILRPCPVSFAQGEEIEDYFDIEVTRWLERQHVMATPTMVTRVVDDIARKNSFHPVREYLEDLPPWDETPRIGNWLIRYCAVEASEYARVVGRKFLIAAVARIMEPGCKVDHILILEGVQGIGKSTVPRILAGDDFFSDQLADFGHKDAAMQLRGRWIIEFSELDVFNRSEITRINAFLTQRTDRFRPPYGRRIIEFPRQCIFFGTTNQDTWAHDETGGRRFWPVRCAGEIHVDQLIADRNQLWAEALSLYREGVKWWLEDDAVIREAKEEQRGRYLPDPWQEQVIECAERIVMEDERDSATVYEILTRMGVKTVDQDQRAANRVARCLKFAKWDRKRMPERNGNREWRYVRPL